MGLGEIIKAIVEYGLLPVFCAVAIFLILMDNKKTREAIAKREEEDNKKEEAMTQAIIKALSSSHNYTEQEEEKSQKVSTYVNSAIKNLRDKLGCNRVGMYCFHNGEYLVNGQSFKKISLVYENVDDLTVSIMKDFQNIPRQAIPTIIEAIYKDKYVALSDVSILSKHDTLSYYHLNIKGIKSFYAVAVIDQKTGVCLGFLSCEYTQQPDEVHLKYIIEQLKATAYGIGGALAMSDEEDLIHGQN